MKRVWCLYRVSTKGQVDKDDIPMQRIACREFVSQYDGWVIENELYEKGVSGYKVSTNERDKIQEIKAAALAKKFDVLLVFMFDRIGRREDETPFVVQWLVEQGIEVWSTREGQQRFDSHVDKLLNYIRYWQAAGESEKTAYRIRTRHMQMALEGTYRGGLVPYGYRSEHLGRVNKKGTPVRDLVVDEIEAAIIQTIFHLIVDMGFGTNRVANWLNEHNVRTKRGTDLWRASGIRAIIRNPIYIGFMRFNGERSEQIEGYRIVGDYTFNKANELVERRASGKDDERHGARKHSAGLLTGIIYCGECGERLTYNACHKYRKGSKSETIEWSVYRCYRKVNSRNSCSGQSTYMVHRVETVVLNVIRRFFENLRSMPDEALLKSAKANETSVAEVAQAKALSELEDAQKAMNALEAEAMKALTGQGGLDISMVNQMLPKYRERLEAAQQSYEEARRAAESIAAAADDRAEEIALMRSWADTFDAAPLDAKRMVLAALIDRVEVSSGYRITIKLRATGQQFRGEELIERTA